LKKVNWAAIVPLVVLMNAEKANSPLKAVIAISARTNQETASSGVQPWARH
jgi:hypothetical protein